MKPELSLKRTYQKYGLAFLAITLLINSIIPLCMMCTGMFSMNEITMNNAAQGGVKYLTDTGFDYYQTENIVVAPRWNQLPKRVRDLHQNTPLTPDQGILYSHTDGLYIDSLMAYRSSNDRIYYVWLHYNATHDLVFAPKNMTAILLLVIMTFSVSASLAYYMQRQVIRPVHQISAAIKQHDWRTMRHFDFPTQCYAELQSIVDALDNALEKLKQAQQRELDFLRYASHELRTPIAVCQSSFEVMSLEQNGLAGPALHASRATEQMRSITETLLWLTNKDSTVIEKEWVTLTPLLREVCDSLQQAHGRQDDILIRGDDTQVLAAREPLAILLTNLVRNALQHGAGEVYIEQRGHQIEIRNSIANRATTGFGLGLSLVQRLAAQLNWQYQNEQIDGQFVSKVTISK